MYDQDKLIKIIKKSQSSNSLNEFSRISNVDSAYLSRILNKKRTKPPSPSILEKIANASHGITTYEELMQICGYSEETIESKVYKIYHNLKEFHKYINDGVSDDSNSYEIEGFIEHFQDYISILIDNLSFNINTVNKPILLADIFDLQYLLEDYKYLAGFLCIYNSFIKHLENEGYIVITDYVFVDCFNINSIYDNLSRFNKLELFSLNSKNITIKNKDLYDPLVYYIKKFSTALNLAYLSDFDNNTLTEIFKKKATNNKIETQIKNISKINSTSLENEISQQYGATSIELLEDYNKLNSIGKRKANENIKDLTKINEYTKEETGLQQA